jgi:hypothetical protein
MPALQPAQNVHSYEQMNVSASIVNVAPHFSQLPFISSATQLLAPFSPSG